MECGVYKRNSPGFKQEMLKCTGEDSITDTQVAEFGGSDYSMCGRFTLYAPVAGVSDVSS